MRARADAARARAGLRAAAAAFAAVAALCAGNAVAHESHRHRSEEASRAGIAAADEAQSRHDFIAAGVELDRLLTVDPRDLEARLMRANLRLLAGEFEASRRDCRAALATGELYAGTVCLAAAQTGPGSVERGRKMLAALGDDAGYGVELLRWRLLTGADLAARADDLHAAVEGLERALALDPDHEEVRTQLAEHLLEQGNAGRALELALAPEPSVARLVVRLRAAGATGDARAAAWRRELDGRLDSDRRLGLPAHLREEGQIALFLDDDAVAAVDFARLNFATQKDTRDLRLLADSASAAGDPAQLDMIRDWMVQSGFEHRAVERLVGGSARAGAAGVAAAVP